MAALRTTLSAQPTRILPSAPCHALNLIVLADFEEQAPRTTVAPKRTLTALMQKLRAERRSLTAAKNFNYFLLALHALFAFTMSFAVEPGELGGQPSAGSQVFAQQADCQSAAGCQPAPHRRQIRPGNVETPGTGFSL